MSLDLSIAQILIDLEAQVTQLEGQEAFHAQQEVFHREQRALRAGELAKIRERYETFKAAATAAGEVVRRLKVEGADDAAPPGTVSKMIARVIESKVAGEKLTPSAMAQPLGLPRLPSPRPQGQGLPRGHLRQELRFGEPGRSSIVDRRRSRGRDQAPRCPRTRRSRSRN